MQENTKAHVRTTPLDQGPEHAHDSDQRVPEVLLMLDQVLENVPVVKRGACSERLAREI